MKPAVIVVDMLEDNYRPDRDGTREEEKIIGPVRDFLREARKRFMPVIFACDSFLEGDFIFRGRMKPHALRGTDGTRPLADLEPRETDVVLEKRRFSAFFKTDLDQTLRTLGCDTVAVCGIQTQFCVLATVFDALCHDFRTILLEDLSSSHKREVHRAFMNAYRKSLLLPILRVMTSHAFLDELDKKE
jgi:nicotinamidase/pyrazinamidase